MRLAIETDYPWDGRVTVEVLEAPDAPWTLTLRRPAWADRRRWPGPTARPTPDRGPTRRRGRRSGAPATESCSTSPCQPRLTVPDPRIDAVRGCVAIERGPLVYCVETADLPAGVELEDVAVDPAGAALEDLGRDDLAAGVVGLTVEAVHRAAAEPGWPYGPGAVAHAAHANASIGLGAIPYFAWANRDVEAMRVWLPVTEARPTR